MSNMKFKGLLAGAAVGAIFALSGGQASAATCDPGVTPDGGTTAGVTITDIGGTALPSAREATACAQATADNIGTGGGGALLDELNGVEGANGLFDAIYSGAGLALPEWDLVGKIDDDGQEGDVTVSVTKDDSTADSFGLSGTWSADFGSETVNELVIGLKGGDQSAAFLFTDLSLASLFAGTYNMGDAGFGSTELSNLTVSGVFVNREGDTFLPSIPLPAGLPLVLTGLGVFGALRLRKRKTA